MAVIEVTAKKVIGGVEKSAVCFIDFGENLADATSKFGEDVVFSNFVQKAKIDAQAAMRRRVEAGESSESIANVMAAWRPGVALARSSDPVAALKAKWGSMTAEERKAVLSDLKGM